MRVAFVISDQHLIPAGGIGQFAKGFVEQIANPNDIFVDFILDKKPSKDFVEKLNFKGSIYYPDTPLSYSGHTSTFAFGESINWEKHINFRNAMMKAFNHSIYDCIIVNTPEAYAPVYGLCVETKAKVVFYTHSEYLAGFEDYSASTFYPEFISYYKNMMHLPDIYVGTQTEQNVDRIKETYLKSFNVISLPMPIPEVSLLHKIDVDKKGILFIGRWEDRKNPAAFIKAIEETKQIAKVMTNDTGAKKFKKALDEIGAEYQIVTNIIGDEKSNFIASASVYYNPSKLESFGFSMLEGLSQCQTVVLENYDWHDNFEGFEFKKTTVKTASSDIMSLINNPIYKNTKKIQKYNDEAITTWMKFIGNKVKTNSRDIKDDNFWYRDRLTNLGRDVSIEDIISLYNHKNKYFVVEFEDNQWFSSTNQPPAEQDKQEFF